ncbi:MAG: metal-dependent transcriptional regulator [Clostridia bacterium]|nr:metal-dependent transcriptional regulator [Clostridia bacterium]
MVVQIRQTQSAEDYLETILLLAESQPVVHRVDVAKQVGVSQAAVNKAMKILLEKGFIYEDGKHLFLTEEGRSYAKAVFEKHCIIRDFLLLLGVSPETAEEDACKMEHVVSPQTVECMKKGMKK